MHGKSRGRTAAVSLALAALLAPSPAAAQDQDKEPPKPPPADADLDPEREILREARSDSRNLKPDALLPIRSPSYLGGLEAPRMDPEEWVVGVVLKGKAYAYPVNVLNYHEIVLDTVEETPIMVCW
jgi:hypothetical protein